MWVLCSLLQVMLPMSAKASPGIPVTTGIWVTALHARTPPGQPSRARSRNVTKPRKPSPPPNPIISVVLGLDEGPEMTGASGTRPIVRPREVAIISG
jgi:hypothetical protein